MLQPYLYYAHLSSVVSTDQYNVFLWRSCIWFPLFLGGWAVAWSTLLQPLVMVTRVSSDSRLDLARYPTSLNIFFIATPIIFGVVANYYAIKTNIHGNDIFRLYQQLDGALTLGISEFNPGMAPNPEYLATLSRLTAELKASGILLATSWAALWGVSAVVVLAQVGVSFLCFISSFHFCRR